ncbi:MAG: hypothetical protein ACI9XO_000052 [Paraglaciecola sp.]
MQYQTKNKRTFTVLKVDNSISQFEFLPISNDCEIGINVLEYDTDKRNLTGKRIIDFVDENNSIQLSFPSTFLLDFPTHAKVVK